MADLRGPFDYGDDYRPSKSGGGVVIWVFGSIIVGSILIGLALYL